MPVYAFIDTRTNRIAQLSQQLPQDILNFWEIQKNKFPSQITPNYVEKAIEYNNNEIYKYLLIPFEIMSYYTLHLTKNEQNEYVINYVDTRPPPEQITEPQVPPPEDLTPLEE